MRSKMSTKFGTASVPRSRVKLSKVGSAAHVSAKVKKPPQTRIYTKAVANQDPSQFTGFGFGTTGLTGES